MALEVSDSAEALKRRWTAMVEDVVEGVSAQTGIAQQLFFEAEEKLREAEKEVTHAKDEFDRCKSNLDEVRRDYESALADGTLSDEREGKVQREIKSRERMVELSFKILEMEEMKRKQQFERFVEAERLYLGMIGSPLAGPAPVHETTTTPQISQPPTQRNFIKRKRVTKLGKPVDSLKRLSCLVPFHGFMLDEIAACYSPQRGFDLDKINLLYPTHSNIFVNPLSRPLIQSPNRPMNNSVKVSSSGYHSVYGTLDNVPMWGMPHTIHDPTWEWSFDEEDFIHAQRQTPSVHGNRIMEDGSVSHNNVQHVFIFEFGCVVTWNLHESQELALVSSLQVFGIEPSKQEGSEYASESIYYEHGSPSGINNDVVTLESGSFGERLAYSYAFAQSSLLRLFEWRTLQVINRNEHIPLTLINEGTIHMSQSQISREIGWVFFERAKISLTTSTDPAQYFWENSTWESSYSDARSYFDIAERKDRLNKKLAQMKELFELLNSQAANIHGVHLEWIVIWLIVIEVLCELVWNILVKDVYGFRPHQD